MPAIAKKNLPAKVKVLVAKRASSGAARFGQGRLLYKKKAAVRAKGISISFDISDEQADWQNRLVESGARLLIE